MLGSTDWKERAVSEPEDSETDDSGSDSTRPAWPRRPQRLATAVVEDLVDRLVASEFASGAVLPTEPALCSSYGVSRTVIREAVKAMESMRLVTVQQGQGTTVRRFEEWDLLNPVVLAATVRHDAELSILEDLIDVRRALEAQMAGQAAEKATAEHLTAIEAAMDGLRGGTQDPAHYLQADLDFHDRIMAASGNRLGRAVIHTINAEAFRSLRYVGDPTPAECELSNVAHEAILARLLARDVEGSGAAMNDHIIGSWHRRRPTRPQVTPAASPDPSA